MAMFKRFISFKAIIPFLVLALLLPAFLLFPGECRAADPARAADAISLPSTPVESTWVTDGDVNAIECLNGIIYIGGSFTHVGPVGGPMVERNHLAAIDETTGRATSWNPNADDTVMAIESRGSSCLLVGGYFHSVGGTGRNHLAAVNTSGSLLSWNPNANDAVFAIRQSSLLWVGGLFTSCAGGKYLVGLYGPGDFMEGTAFWTGDVDFSVETMATIGTQGESGFHELVGGSFTSIMGNTRNRIASMNLAVNDWNPNADSNVEAIATTDSVDYAYAGGWFHNIGGAARNCIAQLSMATGKATSWNPNADSGILCMDTLDSMVLAGGAFQNIGGQPRNRVAAIDASTGKATSWNPNADSWVESIACSDSYVYIGGDFHTIGGKSRAHFARFPIPHPTAWYLAEGTTAWGFSSYITIENPNGSSVRADVTYNTADGPVSGGTINLPANSQTTINPADKLGEKDFSTYVEAPGGETIAVDRTMQWTGEGASSPEAHNSIGVTSPSKTWYLPEGSSAWGFECWLLIQNPGNTNATCQVTYMIEGGDPVTVNKTVPKGSRQTYNMADDIGARDASIKVVSDQPVIPERAMYRNNRREGHDSIGTTAPAGDYYLAEGALGYDSGYITYVLIQNPQNETNKVTVTYLTGSGEIAGPTIDMPANSRKTIRVNDQLPPATDVSTTVHGNKPIIAERAMYWNSSAGEACHDSIGMSAPHTTFYLPDGQTSEGRETWTLVANPNDSAVKVKISYLCNGGKGNKVFEETIPANSRKTFNMVEKGINGRAAVLVQSLTSGKKIMCERAMYWNSRGAGTDTIGGYGD